MRARWARKPIFPEKPGFFGGKSRGPQEDAGPRYSRTRRWVAGTWPGTLTGLLLWLSFPPAELGWIAWFALVPLATLIRARWRSQPIYRTAWAGGLVFGLLAVQWLRYTDDTGLAGYYAWWTLAIYLSFYFPAFLLVARMAVLRFHVPAILTIPVVWVGLEYLRSWLFSGFPWYYLGHTQYHWTTLIQIADLEGAYGVSLLVALVNGWLFDMLNVPLLRPARSGARLAPQQIWRLGLTFGALLVSLAYGWIRLEQVQSRPGPRVALIQTNVPQQIKIDPKQTSQIRRGYDKLLRQAARELDAEAQKDDQPVPSLIIWPETVLRFPFYQLDPDLTDAGLRRWYPDLDAGEVRATVSRMRDYLAYDWPLILAEAKPATGEPYAGKPRVRRAALTQAAMLIGVNLEHIAPDRIRQRNSALLVFSDGTMARPYHKVHLVPWGEYLPLADWLPWLHVLTPHASADYGLEPGSEPVRFDWEGYRLGVLICFEDTVPWAARAYLRSDPVDILVNISNDGWFGGSAELDVHLAISVFRAVECRRPLVRAVNTGCSAIIDSSGRVLRVASSQSGKRKLAEDVVVGSVPLDHRQSLSLYVRWGDWVGQGALGATTLVVVCGMLSARPARARNRKKPQDTSR